MPKKILVIDDEELIIKSLSKLLEKNGYEVFVAKNQIIEITASDAVKKARAQVYGSCPGITPRAPP
jgi:CheY-like chemotaxis protein